jgi:hypothetical protein
VTLSANIFGVIVGDEVEDLPWVVRHRLPPILDGEKGLVTEKTAFFHHGDSTHLKNLLVIQISYRTPLRNELKQKMGGRHRKSRYQDVSFLQELIFFFISSFLSFPSYVRRIILCFIYSDDHKPTTVYPSLKEEDMHSSYIVDVNPSPSSETYENNFYIQILPEHDQPCNHVNDTTDSPPPLIIVPSSTTTAGICNQSTEPHFHPTVVQTRIKIRCLNP